MLGDTSMAAGLGTIPCQVTADPGCTWGREGAQGHPSPLGECPSTGWHVFEGTRKGQASSLEVFGEDQGSIHQLSLLSPQFREKLQDVLPSLPSQDDYFLLKWLRGNPKVGTALVGWEPPWGWQGAELSALLQHAPSTCPRQR